MQPVLKLSSGAKLAYEQEELDIKNELKSSCHNAYLIYCPTDIYSNDEQIFELPYHNSLLQLLKVPSKEVKTNSFLILFSILAIDKGNQIETWIIAYSQVAYNSLKKLILPDMDLFNKLIENEKKHLKSEAKITLL
jgi:hypothetical protein